MLVEVSFAKTVNERRHVVIIVRKLNKYIVCHYFLIRRSIWMHLPVPLVSSSSGSTASLAIPVWSLPMLTSSVYQTLSFGSLR